MLPASVSDLVGATRSQWHPHWSRTPFCVRTGLALKQLTDAEGRPHYGGKGQGGRSAKGKWLSEKVKEAMTSISMNEDLYDSDDEDAPPLPSDLRRQVATRNNHAGSRCDPTTYALVNRLELLHSSSTFVCPLNLPVSVNVSCQSTRSCNISHPFVGPVCAYRFSLTSGCRCCPTG